MEGLDRLISKQEEEIEHIQGEIDRWTKFKEDYVELKKKIDTLPNKVQQKINVPLAGSNLAFVPGNIIHTNEILVLLGENYFALRSAKQASELIKRRLLNIQGQLAKLSESKTKTEQWLVETQQHKREKEEFVEIIETMW